LSAPTFVDLFAGAGGLSLGLHSAGFRPLLAVESSPLAAETYFRNFIEDSSEAWTDHLSAPSNDQLRRGLVVGTTESVLNSGLRQRLPARVDLLAGGPPCQGFSLAGLRDPADRRNQLPFEFLAFVRELRPRGVLIENVLGIGLSFSRRPDEEPALVQLGRALREMGYFTEILFVNARHFGVAQNRPRVMVAGLELGLAKQRLGRIPTRNGPPEWHSSRPTPSSLLAPLVSSVEVPARAVLGDLDGQGYVFEANEYPEDLRPARSLRCSEEVGSPLGVNHGLTNHILRSHSSDTRDRFRLIQQLHAHGIRGNPFALAAKYGDETEGIAAIEEALRGARDQLVVFGGEPAAEHLPALPDLAARIYALRSRKHSQRLMDPNKPSQTVVTLPDDLVHYASPRVPTVRELARLQSIPDSFVFHGKVTTGGDCRVHEVPQYSQVGNAVPPLLAKAIGLRFRELLEPG